MITKYDEFLTLLEDNGYRGAGISFSKDFHKFGIDFNRKMGVSIYYGIWSYRRYEYVIHPIEECLDKVGPEVREYIIFNLDLFI